MQPNSLLKKLGLADNDRVVVLHADDVGMCQASLAAYIDLVDSGLVLSASAMVPCPWFPATAAFCRNNADVDMGVHLTLTSEWEGYRWRPLSTCDPASGLLDATGHFHAIGQIVQEQAATSAVQREIQSQIERALAAGIDVTHIDSHMYTLFHPRLLEGYVQTALQHRVPPLLLRHNEARLRKMGVGAEAAAFFAQQTQELEEQGVPMMDHLHMMLPSRPGGRLEQVRRVLDTLAAGLTCLVIHPAQDTPELQAITPDWRARIADYQAFTSETLRAHIQNSGIHVIGYRLLRDLMRNELAEP